MHTQPSSDARHGGPTANDSTRPPRAHHDTTLHRYNSRGQAYMIARAPGVTPYELFFAAANGAPLDKLGYCKILYARARERRREIESKTKDSGRDRTEQDRG